MKIDLTGVIDENDYIRYSQKFLNERKQLEENIASLQYKVDLLSSNEKKEVSNQEAKEKTKNFLKSEYINKEILFDIVDRIEVDQDKKIYIHFNFEQLNVYDSKEIDNVSVS